MTTGSGMLDSGTTADDASVTGDKVSSEPTSDSAIGSPADVHGTRVVDEEFRSTVEKMMTGVATMPDNWDDLTVRQQRDWIGRTMKDRCPTLPDSLVGLSVGSTINGDPKVELAGTPDWLDREKFARGQRFAVDNFAAISFAELISLYTLFSFEHGLKPLIITGKSGEPFTAFKRYLSTGVRVRNWYTTDLWTEGTAGRRDIQNVRRMHASIRKKLRNSTHDEIDEAATIRDAWSSSLATVREDFMGSCPAYVPGQCPYIVGEDEQFKRPAGLSQGEMGGTQFGFMGLIILYPEKFGIHGASDEDLDAYCHVWRGIGYLLGVEDEFNFCTGSLEEVKQRTRDFIEHWVKPNLRNVTPEWEHMARCLIEGVRFYFPTVTYEHCLLYLAEILEIDMPRLQASQSYATWFRLNAMKFLLNWTVRLPTVTGGMNKVLAMAMERAVNFTDEELAVLRKKSDMILAKGIAETTALKKDAEIATTKAWQSAPFYVFSSASFLLSMLVVVKEYTRKLLHVISADSGIPS